MESTTISACIIVIFGGTGDLARRKLLPAIYNLFRREILPESFAVVATGRQDKSNDEYRLEVADVIRKYARLELDEAKWSQIRERFYYCRFEFEDPRGYQELNRLLNNLDEKYQTCGNRIYYLATAPEFFEVIVHRLQQQGMVCNQHSWQRLAIEKPFGRDLASARQLNRMITGVFLEQNIYRIDHYLGKEMLQNLMVIRFANIFFEPVWNHHYIDHVRILASETVGVENRGGYYEKAGALRDMVQSHMLQLLTLVAMEPPTDNAADSIRNEKVKILRALVEFSPETIREQVVVGQYDAGMIDNQPVNRYRDEDKVAPDSVTETFVALKAFLDHPRWTGVPFYIRTGKRLTQKATEVTIQFKAAPQSLFFAAAGRLEPDVLTIKIQPQEGASFQFNVKQPGTRELVVPITMDYCQNCLDENNSPESYERLFREIIHGDQSLFTRWDEVEYAWKYISRIHQALEPGKEVFPNYPAGSWGPEAAVELLKRDGRKWRNSGGERRR